MLATIRFLLASAICALVLAGCASSTMVRPYFGHVLTVDGARVTLSGNPTLLEVLRGATYAARLGEESAAPDRPLVVVDGVARAAGLHALATLQAIEVDSVLTVRGTRAAALYGPEARSGAVVVHTRKTVRDQ